MSYSHYDRLTALDASFLGIEDANAHMHVGSVGLFDIGPLKAARGGLDMERVLAMSDSVLARHPRFRQKLARVPLFGNPVWVDDERFNLSYHVRHTALPPPGDERQLKRLTGRIMSQQLDRGKPLWELWYVEGLADGRFAVITKLHHCMADGVSGADLMASMMGPDPRHAFAAAPRWLPRPAPTPARLVADEALRLASLPADVARAGSALLTQPRRSLAATRDALGGLGEALWAALVPASATPLNCDIGPHRRFDWTKLDLDVVKGIKNRLGATINDVVLAVVTGALRSFLRRRGEQVDDLTFRAMIPVNVRASAERGRLGNRVSFMMAPLPLAERDPARRLGQVVETMRALKRSSQRRGGELIEEVSDRVFSGLFTQVARLGARTGPYNIVITNVPGPQFPVYLLGAPLREVYPLVPLFSNQALGIALFSYDGGLYFGFNADWDAVPDLHDVVEAVQAECQALSEVAAIARPAPPVDRVEPQRSPRHPRRPARARRPPRAAARP
jgi:diacylglycerol O-acyltransferase / wax synthase